MTLSGGERTKLDTWKAVSAYFGCDPRTVRRWEAERGLPIHRLPGGKRSHIFAEVSELESWLRGVGQATPSGASRNRLQKHRHRRKTPFAAQEFYVAGVRAWMARTPASLNGALDAFNSALRIDPYYAEALAGLATTFNLLREYTFMPDAQAYPLARDAARRALALDDSLSDAHAALAFVEYWGFWNAEAAQREFEVALSLDPNWATGHHWYATFLDARADHDGALREIELALQIDPAPLAARADRGLLLFHAGRQEEAIAELQLVASKDPSFGLPYKYLASIFLTVGRDRDYLREAKRFALMSNDHPELACQRAAEAGRRLAGRPGMLAALLADRIKRADAGAAPALSVAIVSALAGDYSLALTWLQKSLDKRETEFVHVVFDPAFHGMRGLPEFQALLSQLKPA